MIERLKQELTGILDDYRYQKLPDDRYSHMKYPRILTLMDFYVDQYRISGFGRMMLMHTKTKMGMELLTVSLMPAGGLNLPFLLLDAMTMKEKRCIFVEYYGCGNEDLNDARLKEVHERYKDLEEYPEKDKWYVHEREPYSLIKKGIEDELTVMAADAFRAYLSSVSGCHEDPEYVRQLEAFRERMIREGNPSSSTLNMLLKKDGAETFMKEAVMPVE